MSTWASPLSLLSQDTRNHVLEFLPLQSCFRYSQVSQQSLRDLLPHMKQRRWKQFYHRYAYQLGGRYGGPSFGRLVPTSEIKEIEKEIGRSATLQPMNGARDQWHIVPSVMERIHDLVRGLPISHSAHSLVQELVTDLRDETSLLLSDQGIVTSNFATARQEWQALTKAHRLHDQILNRATLSSSLPPRPEGNNLAGNDPTSLTTTLEQYIGDVLIACILMGHSIAGIIEGRGEKSNHHTRWTKSLLDEESQDNDYLLWYRRWIFAHSTLLRTFPMTQTQLEAYRLPNSGILGTLEPQQISYVHPHYCFLGTGTSVIQETTHIVASLLEPLSNPTGGSPRQFFVHDTRWNSFGPLGPAFRGRDRVESVLMAPQQLLDRLRSPAYTLPPTWMLLEEEGRHVIHGGNDANNANHRAFLHWFTATAEDDMQNGDDVSTWILLLPRECYKNRPMTVEPPFVRMLRLVEDPRDFLEEE